MKQFISAIIIIGVVILSVKSCLHKSKVKTWPEVEAQVTQTQVLEKIEWKTRKYSDGSKRRYSEKEYYLRVNYEFMLKSTAYTGWFDTRNSDSINTINRLQAKYPEGKAVTIKYNPANPAQNEPLSSIR